MIPIRILTLIVLGLGASAAVAQHTDILVQQLGGRLTVGISDLDAGTAQATRVFTRPFPASYAENNPGFNALSSASPILPPGTSALPGSTNLDWDFLSMRGVCATSNLLYWDGDGATLDDVSFGAAPGADYRLYLYGKNNQFAAVDGTPTMVPGHTIETTGANGFMHEHRFFYLDDDTDVNNGSAPAEGYYLISMQLRMEGLEASDPFYVIWSTPGASVVKLEQLARPWVNARVDLFHSTTLPGDYNADGSVDAADYTVWRDTLGSTADLAADGDFNLVVDQGDYDCWRTHYGPPPTAAIGVSAPVPEPGAALLAALASCIALAPTAAGLRSARRGRFFWGAR
ncbi:hypothetical protein Pla175_36450 [Pirellulimonas nuda]|uniref:PEP-CTERM protein-sorting domain-containing protein n=1 Tax=Pirellulimonas nuda TaxID=2528009 RepID=A0A518DFI4_9BACT|nr:hypothetical protein [Pirellulimonas nuda]QDU90243.1 hypothetical protein Pla175_36450 [Pirellulimonas nuda]